MGLRNSVLKNGEQHSVTKHQWYREKNITDLNWLVHLLDILELELSNEPPHYKLLLVIGRFELENDLEVAYIISGRDDPESIVFYTASLREVIADRRVRIYDETDRSTHILKARNRYDEAIDSIMFRVMGRFLGNKSVEPLISSLVEEIPRLSGETVEDIQSLVTNLVEVALRLLIGLASQGFKDQAERNKEKVTSWFDKNHIIESELRACDRLEFSRLFYNHWGMFLGKLGDRVLVLHFSTAGSGKKYSIKKTSGLGSSAMDKPAYRIDSIKKPLSNRRMRINNRLVSAG
ncbi:uncharacterized protein LOC119725807 [Patiria miniata]|uniref:Uncharacterized protein n=1 Tax=Patiria miniata TaxID=46514 RepID=A0A913ZPM5_PATMI|nr:uncharacterized protein LOC119725807 [Patiria miniata]